MFCFQCEQTAGCTACTGKRGVCGKSESDAGLQDELTGAIIGLARAAQYAEPGDSAHRAVIGGLFTTVTNVCFDEKAEKIQIEQVLEEKEKLRSKAGLSPAACENYHMDQLWKEENEDVRSLKSLLLFGLRGMASYAYHALMLGFSDGEVNSFFYKGMEAVGSRMDAGELLPLVMETGKVNLKCMELLDRANTETYGDPSPVRVPLKVEKGPFIVISGHDLHDMELLLEQTEGKGVNIYTHGEMLPAHAYPKFRKYSHLKGNIGTAWQNQQKEFDEIPAPVLFTTNCLMPPKESYADRVFTTEVVAYPGMVHIGEGKDFTPVIEKALELGGYKEDVMVKGPNGGTQVATGFGRNAILAAADQVVSAVKEGKISRFFLVGGCDGARNERNYYREFVSLTPKDSVILTLACGKYRFLDMDLGNIGELPRLMDMGQCNDAYGAIQVALALADAFDCGVNDLPLTLALSWYEQKAVCILLTLLYLGIQNIYIGPTLPAFLSPGVAEILVNQFGLTPVGDPAGDLKKMIGG